MKKPEPKPTAVVCSLCGLAWDRHEKAAKARKTKDKTVNAETCVELLKADLAKRPMGSIISNSTAATGYGTYTLQ